MKTIFQAVPNVRRLLCALFIGGVVVALSGCPGPPPGPDLVETTCVCIDQCNANAKLRLGGVVCTDASNPDNVTEATQSLCSGKETIGFNICKITDCNAQPPILTPHACPADNGEFKSGDFGQTIANAVAPSTVKISGSDIHAFTIAPEAFLAQTTQEGGTLSFTFLQASLGTATFTSDGIFGDSSHTIEDGKLYGAPFVTTLAADGKFSLPPEANFFITGKIDGDRVALTLKSPNLGGVYDETAGLFTLAGTVKAVGADIKIDVDLVFKFANRPPRAVAGPDLTVECSAGNRTGTVRLSGGASSDPDGSGDLSHFTWYVDGVEAAAGSEADVPMSLGPHEVKLIVADQQGSFGGDTLAVSVVDTRAPGIAIAQPKPIAYTHSDTLVLDYSVTDVCTGVAGFTPRLDGAETVGGHGLPSGQPIHLLTELALGEHTFAVQAVDAQGNPSSAAVTFSIVVTPESIEEDVRQLAASGAITHSIQSLLAKLEAAARKFHDGKCGPAGNGYQAFLHEVKAQRGKSIDPAAADILTTDAQFLIDHCP
ncbi:MAG TPA: hypothetical protein VN851_18060 [Thermoanaerobaculia bacterium]|nr:hypothetical protein [Thermoanaerobaculia bacterium]